MAEPKVSLLLQLVDKITGPMNRVKGGVNSLGSSFGALGTRIAAVATTAALGAFFKSAIEEANNAERSVAMLSSAVGNAGESFAGWGPKINNAIDGLVKVTTYSDDDLRDALTNLIQNTGNVGGSLQNMGLVADIAAAKNLDLGTASDIVSKAMNGNNRALKEFGIFVPTGTVAVETLTNLFAGAASTAADTFGGKVQQLGVRWGEFKEDLGRAIIEANGAENALDSLGVALDVLAREAVAGVNLIVGFIGKVVQGWQMLVAGVQAGGEAMVQGVQSLVGRVIYYIGVTIEATLAKLPLIGDTFDGVGASMQAAGEAMVRGSHANIDRIQSKFTNHVDTILGYNDTMETGRTTRAARGAIDRGSITKKESDERGKAIVAFGKLAEQVEKDFRAEMPAAVAKVKEQMAAVIAKIEEWKDSQSHLIPGARALLAQYEMQLPVAHGLGRAAAELSRIEKDPARITSLFALNDLMKQATDYRELSAGHTENTKAADALILSIKRQLATVTTGLLADTSTLADETQRSADADDRAKDAKERARDKMREVREEVTRAANMAVNLAAQFGIIDQKSAATLSHMIGVASALGSGDIIGAVGSLVGALGSILGRSPEEQRLFDSMKRMRDSLDRLRDRIGDLMNVDTPGAIIAAFKKVTFSDLNSVRGEDAQSQVVRGGEFRKLLARNNLTMADADQLMMAMTGESLAVGQGGKMSAAAVQMFIDAMNASEFGQFAQNFESQQEVSESIRRASGNDTPEAAAADLIRNLRGEGGSTMLADFLSQFIGADGSINAGIARTGTAELLRTLNAGGFNEANFGGFTGSEFVDAINTFVGYIGDPPPGDPPPGDAPPGFDPTESFAAPNFATPEESARVAGVFDQIEVNTRLTAENTRIIADLAAVIVDLNEDQLFALRLARAPQGGPTLTDLDVALQSLTDLSSATAGTL